MIQRSSDLIGQPTSWPYRHTSLATSTSLVCLSTYFFDNFDFTGLVWTLAWSWSAQQSAHLTDMPPFHHVSSYCLVLKKRAPSILASVLPSLSRFHLFRDRWWWACGCLLAHLQQWGLDGGSYGDPRIVPRLPDSLLCVYVLYSTSFAFYLLAYSNYAAVMLKVVLSRLVRPKPRESRFATARLLRPSPSPFLAVKVIHDSKHPLHHPGFRYIPIIACHLSTPTMHMSPELDGHLKAAE